MKIINENFFYFLEELKMLSFGIICALVAAASAGKIFMMNKERQNSLTSLAGLFARTKIPVLSCDKMRVKFPISF